MGSFTPDAAEVAAALAVMLVLAGHVTLESGLVKAKHSVNAAAKALVQAGLTALLVWAVGHGLMGPGGPLAGAGPFLPGREAAGGSLLAHIVLAAAAATILSGPIAERATLRGYAVAAGMFSAVIFPVIVHWGWAGGEAPGWLRAAGFVDFAGGGIVHVAGGVAALTAAHMVGPRASRGSGQRLVTVQSQSFPFAALGMVLAWLGWCGLAAGQGLAAGIALAPVMLNLVLAGAAGIVVVFLANQARPAQVPILALLPGTLAGLIAASAGAHLMTPVFAVAVGALGAAAALAGQRLIAEAGIDDALGLAAAHVFAGAAGVLAAALLGPEPVLAALAVQVSGLIAIGAWAAGIMAAGLAAAARLGLALKVAPEAERIGLNVAEHGVTTDVALLISRMDAASRQAGAFFRLDAEGDDEVGQVAREYNRAVDIFRAQIEGVRAQLGATERAFEEAQSANHRLAADLSLRDRRLEEATREVAQLTDQLAHALVAVQGLQNLRHGLVRLIGRTFRTPIDRLHVMAERAGASRDPAAIDALIEAARQESARLARRLADVIDFAQASAFATAPIADLTPVEKVIGEVNLLHRGRAEAKGVKLRVVWTPEVAEMAASATALRKIMGELVGRAIDTTPAGGLVNLSAQRGSEGELVIDVVDSGPGISPGAIAQALDPLAETPLQAGEEPAELGLALVKKLVDMHGGDLTIRSKPGVGTQMRATLKAEHAARGAARTG